MFFIELYDVNVEYIGVGSNDRSFKICFNNKHIAVESKVNGNLDTSQPNKIHLNCVVDGTLYRSNVAFLENSVHLFNKVLRPLKFEILLK